MEAVVADENLFLAADKAVTAPGVETASPDVREAEVGKGASGFVECLMLASVSSAKEGAVERTKPGPDDENGLRETNLSNDCVREPAERLRDFEIDSRWDGAVEVVVVAWGWAAGKCVVDVVAG